MEKLIPELRFPEFEGDWQGSELSKFCEVNPRSNELPEEFIYIDLESVEKGQLGKKSIVNKKEAPSRAKRTLKPGDVLYQTVRPYQRNNYYFKERIGDYVASTGYAQLRASKNNSKFLFQILHDDRFVDRVMLRCTGTSYPAINSTDLGQIEIFFPSLPEQTKIAEFLTAIDKRIELLTTIKEKLTLYKKGVMQKIFNQEMRFKDENGEEFPDWEEKTLGEVGQIIRGASPRPQGDKRYYGGDVPRLMVKDVTRDGKYVTPRIDFLTEEGAKLSRPCKAGTLTIVCSGTVGIPSFLAVDACIHDGFLALINIDSKYSEDYIYHILTTLREKFESSATHGGVFTNLTTGAIKDFAVMFPSLIEQKRIAAFLTSLDDQIQKVEQQITLNQTYKKGLLRQMFV